ncbi:uncharacterized protein [Fopius arisanus]|uniref:Uncharacterized protein isoform X2 n=1 Tax=Fopius arisanus TaxID=64838 RepID=A0A9R1TGU0_9HYME|nr:PREDICTED: uncharacterized protein LOC105270271 isoform X2 [Fopius arisanus]
MNINIKNSLMMGRRIRIEESGLLAEKKQDRCSEESTPKRQKAPQTVSQESQTQEARSSPILLTQDTNNEVAWDWQSPQTKTKQKSRPESSSTPKRTRIVHKKRTSNSPLVYKPFKKRIIKKEDSSSIDKWKNEFLALTAQIETRESHEAENVELNGISDEIIFDDDDLEDDVIIISDILEDPPVNQSGEKDRESLEDLFNDSINEETMLRCSQEIEAKLNIGPPKEVPLADVRKSPVSTPSRFKKHKSEPIDKNSRINQEVSQEFKASELFDLYDIDFPDDSFDDLVKAACAQASKYEDTTAGKSEKVGKLGKLEKSEARGGNFNSRAETDTRGLGRGFQGRAPVQGTSDGIQRSSQMPYGSDRRFFKSRNRSDSSFDTSSRLSSMASCSGIGVGSRGGKTSSSIKGRRRW